MEVFQSGSPVFIVTLEVKESPPPARFLYINPCTYLAGFATHRLRAKSQTINVSQVIAFIYHVEVTF